VSYLHISFIIPALLFACICKLQKLCHLLWLMGMCRKNLQRQPQHFYSILNLTHCGIVFCGFTLYTYYLITEITLGWIKASSSFQCWLGSSGISNQRLALSISFSIHSSVLYSNQRVLKGSFHSLTSTCFLPSVLWNVVFDTVCS
jgi:hypothetical protein